MGSRGYKRLLVLIGVQCLFFALLVGRMYYLQIIEGHTYKDMAEGNRVAQRPLLAKRGTIYDRFGVILATNETDFRVIVLADSQAQREMAIEEVAELIGIDEDEKEALLKKVKGRRALEPFIIKEHLTWEEVAQLELHTADLPGVDIELGHHRSYPLGDVGAHILGYVGSVSENEAENFPNIPGLKVGKQGLEKHFEISLLGQAGVKELEVNARRKIVRELGEYAAIPGEDLHLSLDGELQTFIQERLSQEESASVVVMDVETGEVLGLVSSPSFDLNLFPNGIREKDWGPLRDNPYVPLTNKALSGVYPPGSTVKTLVILSALEEGIIDKNTTIHCPGHMEISGHRFHCWRHEGHGSVNAERALRESCDVFLYDVARKVGIDKLSKIYRDFGLGETHTAGLSGEKKGLVPDKTWKRATLDQSWYQGDTVQAAIGQGYMLATPLQLAVMTARLVSGKKIEPQFIKVDAPPAFPSLGLVSTHQKIILDALAQVTNDPTGTSYRWRILEPGYEMAGKTGTSQVRRISLKDRKAGITKTHHLPWKFREHGLFVGYAPLVNPRYAIAVVVEHAAGASVAAHVGRDVLLAAQKRVKKVTP